jgi:hypothetical protein
MSIPIGLQSGRGESLRGSVTMSRGSVVEHASGSVSHPSSSAASLGPSPPVARAVSQRGSTATSGGSTLGGIAKGALATPPAKQHVSAHEQQLAAALSASGSDAAARRARRQLKLRRRELRRQRVAARNARARQAASPSLSAAAARSKLCKFTHFPGARVHAELPTYRMPSGELVFLYFSGGPYYGEDRLEDVAAPPLPPSSQGALGLPRGALPVVPRVAATSAAALPVAEARFPVEAPTAPRRDGRHSLWAFKQRQPVTSVSWTSTGRVLDEPIPMLTCWARDVPGLLDAEAQAALEAAEEARRRAREAAAAAAAEAAKWTPEQSVFASRLQQHGSFYNDKALRNDAMEADFALCEQKRVFRKLLSRHQGHTAGVQAALKQAYGLICNLFRYYSCVEPQGCVFALEANEFTEFCTRGGLREQSLDGGFKLGDGATHNIFLQCARGAIEEPTQAEELFELECADLSLRKGTRMMRFQFMEAVLRLAEARYFEGGAAGARAAALAIANSESEAEPGLGVDMPTAVRRLLLQLGENPLHRRIDGCFDSFRRRELYCEEVDSVLSRRLRFLKELFLQFAGTSKDSARHGGLRGRRLTHHEWQELLASVGVFNPLFTLRESANIFRSSSLDVADEVADWRMLVSLTFVDFLEAIARLATLMVIPSRPELEVIGADCIEDYYRVCESTGLWLILHQQHLQAAAAAASAAAAAAADTDQGGARAPRSPSPADNVPARPASPLGLVAVEACLRPSNNAMPLPERLEQLLELLEAVKRRGQRLELEKRLWRANPRQALEREAAERESNLARAAAEIGAQKRAGGAGRAGERELAKLQAAREASKRLLTQDEEEEKEPAELEAGGEGDEAAADSAAADSAEPEVSDALRLALEAVEAGVPMHRFEAVVAATLHDVWRERRGKLPDGTYAPRVKTINGVEFDIANLAFDRLPGFYQMDNLLAAHDACESVRALFEQWSTEADLAALAHSPTPPEPFLTRIGSQAFREDASKRQHVHWLKRNGKKEWVEERLKVPWETLEEDEKSKSRDIVDTAIRVWLAHNQNKLLGQQSPQSQPQPQLLPQPTPPSQASQPSQRKLSDGSPPSQAGQPAQRTTRGASLPATRVEH